ncbi:MAG: CocE/NonD family hydrolase, partial [Deltaproteobacteria bacterium]|nr:CocE/NonD family hydrolase [Deltaproteobacteria bacterium]
MRPYEKKLTHVRVRNADGSSTKLAITYAIPTPDYDGQQFPVILEALPYRKDDSMYPVRHQQMDYFASRGFVYAYLDIRGTGGSDGQRVPYEYSDIEIEDETQVIQQLGAMSWSLSNGQTVRSNGSVGLWGQSWSAFTSFLMAGKKARDPRLAPLKTVVPIHGATNFYEGDIHYMDGILHQDEYIASIDHENAMPSYGFNGASGVNKYPIDANYVTNRLNAYPWALFYLGKQLKDGFWTDRTAFFNGPFNRTNPDDYAVPTFVIGSLLDGYRDAPLDMYEKLKAKGVPVKFAMGPSNHSLPDSVSPGPLWDWKIDVAKWMYYWLVDQSDSSLIDQNEFAMYVRRPGSDKNDVPGYWRNQTWPPSALPTKLYLTKNNLLSSAAPAGAAVDHKLTYDPTVGTEMGVWWGEADLGDMAPLDAQSLVYDTSFSTDQELVGFPEVTMRVAATSTEQLKTLLAHWHARLEDVGPKGKVTHVTGASLNGAYRVVGASPSYLKSGTFYDVKVKMHFTTWTFKKNHKARLAITNSMYRMMWPSPNKMVTTLRVNWPGTFLTLPLAPAAAAPTPAHPYAGQKEPSYSEPEDGWSFGEGGYPREYTTEVKNGRKVVTWKADYYSNCYGWLIGVELDHEFSQSQTNPSDTKWDTYARQTYDYVGVTDQNLWGQIYGLPSINKPGPNVPASQRSFRLDSFMTIRSDASRFHGTVDRTLTRSDGAPLSVHFA